MHKSRENKPHVPILALTIILCSSTYLLVCVCLVKDGEYFEKVLRHWNAC